MMADGGRSDVGFGCALMDLRKLMEYRGNEGYQKLQNDYGGVVELCKRLKTSPNEGQSSSCASASRHRQTKVSQHHSCKSVPKSSLF